MPAKAAPKGRVILTYGRSLMALVIARSLAQRGVEVIGCDDVDLTVLSFSKHVKETFAVAPWRSEPERFLDDLEAAVMEHAPHDGRPYVLMPVFSEGELIAKYRERFEPTCKVAMPLWSSFDQVQPKDHLAALAERAGVPAPKTWAVPNEEVLKTLAPTLPYPIIVKPSEGAGGRGVSLVHNAEEAIRDVEALGFNPQPLFQTPAPGSDYCVAVLADKGKLTAIMAYHNITTFPRQAGAGAVRETVDAEPFRDAVSKLLAGAEWDGLAEIDFRWTGDTKDIPQLIEVNPRFWAGIFHSIQTAVDFPWLLWLQSTGQPLDNVDEPDIGARTKTPGVWMLAALEEVAASDPHLKAAGEAWADVKKRLGAGKLDGVLERLKDAAGALSIPEILEQIEEEFAVAKDAPSELTEADPLVGLGSLFMISSLIKHGKLPDEITYKSEEETPLTFAAPKGKPTIGVTMPAEGEALSWQALKFAINQAGADAVRLTALAPGDPRTIDGLIFAGGTDVHPPAYEGEEKPGYRYDLARHDLEASWAIAARNHDIPVLGICRGAQMLNVIAGGTLTADLSAFPNAKLKPSAWEQLTVRKDVTVKPVSKLGRIIGAPKVTINLIHQQAIDRLGAGLTVSARADNGVIQGIEDRSRRFWLGVQYHPELLIYREEHRKLFRALVDAALERRAERAAESADPTAAAPPAPEGSDLAPLH
ncbi:MAG: gamma-glutamyl-gamma-aminobutyrate hydrolase family protein [Caulobacteraceae bacterium]